MNGKRLINAVYKIAVFSFLLVIAGCKENVGLGESIDTVSPEVSINYPPSGAVIMDSFYIGGDCSDDKGVSKISVKLKKIGSASETIVGSYPAEIYEKGKKWKVLMNSKTSEDGYNGWLLQDGSYEVEVEARDEAGHKSSASRSFDIDNTAPVLVVSNPGVSKDSGKDFSSYGSSFSLEGKIADKHKINKIAVSVFDSERKPKKTFSETNLDSGAISLLFARYGSSDTTLAESYNAIYGESSNETKETKEYTCSVTLYDDACVYQDPDSLTYMAEGNSTSTVYFNDDLNEKLLSSKNGLGLSVSSLYEVLSCTYDENPDKISEILNELNKNKKDLSNENYRLGFTLNPDANPTYSVAGYLLKDGNKAASGNTISVSASYGLDQNYLKPETFVVWIREYDSLSEVREADITAIEKHAYGSKDESLPPEGWYELFSNKDYNSNSQANYTFSVPLDPGKINIQLDKYYVIVLTGEDQEGVKFAQKNIYGFVGDVSGKPPKLEILSPDKLSFVKDSEKLEFSGTVESSGSIPLSELKAVLTREDENGISESYESKPVTIKYDSNKGEWESSPSLTVSSSDKKGLYQWSFVPSLCADYDNFKAEEQSGKSYLYTLSVTAVAASGHDFTADSSVHIDTINPEVEITGITPIVDGTDYKGENDSNLYVNGEIFFTGNITETNNIEKGVSYKVLDENGNTLLEHVFDNRIYKFNEKIDTTEIADGTEFEIVVEAKDVVGNKGSYSSKDYTGGKFYIVDQNSDKPVISLKNADMSVKKEQDVLVNAFDCAYAEASINGSVIDDDGIQSVSVKIYDANENLIGGSQSFTSKNNSTTFDFKFTIPKNEGLYLVQITAQDKNFKDSETTPYSEQIADKFLILVDNGAPKFSKVELPDFINSGNLEFKVSVEEKCLDSFDIQLKKDDTEVDAKDFISKSEDGKSITVTIPADPSCKNDGTWTFTATAYDKLEKSNTTLFGPVVIDTTLPVLEFTEEPSKEFVDKSTSQTYKGSVTESNSGISDVLYCLKGFVNGEEKLTEWESAAVKGSKNSAGNIVNDITFKASIDLEQFDDNSSVEVCFKAIDNAGNETSEVSKNLKLDATKPSVTFTAWDDSNPYTKETNFNLSGTVKEKNLSSLVLTVYKNDEKTDEKQWTADEIAALSTGNAEDWSYTYNANEDGKYYFVLTAEDKAGLKDSATSKTVYVDTTGPGFSVDNVENLKNGIYDYSAYTFTGSWSDSLSGTQTLIYSVNGNETSITEFAGQKTWRIENVELTEGLNTFEFWGKDKNGNESSHVKMENVMVDFAKPVVSLTYSVDGGAETSSVPSYIADGAVLKVSGTVTETNGVKGVIVKATKGDTEVESGNSGYSVVTKLEAKTFTVTLTGGSASSGKWGFEISAEDNAERTGETVSFGVNVDVEKPVITAANDAGKKYIDRTATNKYSGNLTETGGSGIKGVYWKAEKHPAGETTDTSDIASWQACAVDASLTGWNLTADLSKLEEGEEYRIFFAAVDNAGNISELKFVDQYLDNTAPKVEELKSSYGVETKKQTLSAKITEKYLSELSLEVTKGGVKDEEQSFTYRFNDTEGDGKAWFDEYVSGEEYSFEISGDGSYVVKLTATDKAGNKTTVTFEPFIIDTNGPTVSVDSSDTKEIFNARTYTFTGSWSDDVTGTAGLYYSVNGKEPVAESGKYPVTKYAGQTNWRIENVALTEGANTFEFWGKDRNGNESAHVKMENVMVDFAEPVVSLTYQVGDGEATSSVPLYIADGAVLTVSGTVTESNGVKAVNVTAKKDGTEVANGSNGYSVVTNPESKTFTITLTGGNASSGEWSFDVEAVDKAGRKSSVSEVKTSVDMTPPQWLTSWGTNGENKFKVDNKEYAEENWYSGAALSFNGCFLETGSGVDQIYYLVIPADESDAVLTESNYTGTITVTGDSNNYWVFNSAISGFKASSNANTVKFMAKDKAGNKSAIQTVTIKRDQIAPAINTDGSTILTNGVLDIKLSGSVSDDASGTASLEITINGIDGFKVKADIGNDRNWTSSLPAETLKTLTTGTTYEVWGKAQDKAGNISESRIAKLNVDKTPPVVKFSDSVKNQAEQGINGVKDIIGTVDESNTPKSLEFFYTLQDPSTALNPDDNNGAPSGWTKIGETVTSAQQIYNWTVSNFDFTEKSSVLTKTNGKATIYILPVAVDEAGNCNAYTKNNSGKISWNLKPGEVGSETAQWLAFNVDASLDRPLITFSDLTDNSNAKDASSLIIKNSDGGIITGLAEDDDGIEIIAISSDEISTETGKTFADLFEEENGNPGTFNGKTPHEYEVSSGTVNGYDKFIYKNGSFEFHPANPLDGKKTIYIYVKDSAGGEFYSTCSTNTGYKVQKNPRIKIKTGNVLDNTKEIEYTSDCTSPVVSSIEIATGDSESAESLKNYSWESGRKIGGTKEKFVKFQVKASDSNGIKTVSLKLKQGSKEETLTLAGSETTNSSTATFTSTESFDLSAFTTGEITVTATATDQTGMSGNSVILPYADFKVEESGFSVISPSATKSEGKLVSDDILTSSLTISGSATESSGCGIETVQWMVQPKIDGSAVTVEQIKSSPSTYESKWSTGKSSATYTQWKFIFDGDTDSVTTETSGGTEISHYPKFEKITSNTKDYNITTENGICKIPLFFKVTDKLGNVAYIDSYVLRYNPDADRPNAKILYPENGKDVGDVIRVNGSAEDNVSVSKVYIQISTVKNDSGIVWAADDPILDKGRSAAAKENPSYLKAVTLVGYDAEKFPEGMRDNWWGIEASGTISWSYSINRYGEFNSKPVDGKDPGTKVYLRACSIDNLGKASVWSDVVEFTVFSGVPKVEFNTIAQFSDNSLSNISAQNTNYEAGSYLTNANGQWYLVVNASHKSGISRTSVSCSTQGTPMTKQTSVTAITGSGEGKYSSYYAEKVAESGSVTNYKLYIPVDTRYEGDVTYTVTATDYTQGHKNNTQSYTYKIDNIAPKIGELTSGNTRNPANTAVAGNKLVNSDGGSASIKSVVKEDISGFTMMAYYFIRNGKIYNPFPGTADSKFKKQKQTGVDVKGDGITSKSVGGQNLYGKTVTGAGAENESSVGNDEAGVYFKASASVTDIDSNIRSGGLILIEGIYYQISKIDGAKIYVKGLSENSKASEAFCPYALVIQYNAEAGDTTESITTGSYSEGYTVNEKDGDGIVETVNKVGTDYTLETNIMSDSIPDGEIEIVCIAFDKAGNASSSSTKTMISNNLPRVSKVWLATDLNQDGYFKKDEFVWYSENNGVEVQNYAYSCLDSSGNGQEIVTLTTIDSRGNQFTVKDKLALTMELLTGGTDNSYTGLSYIAEFVDEPASGPATGKEVTSLSLTDKVEGVPDSLTYTVADKEYTVSQKGILFDSGTFTSYEDTTPYLQLTLWDKVNISADGDGKFIATVDTKDANGIITSYGNQYTVLNIPVKVDITDDVAPKGTITPFKWEKAGSSEGKVNDGSNSIYYSVTGESPNCSYTPFGHIELGDIELGEKPEVSGTVVLTGTVSDDQLMKTVTVEFTLGLGSEAKATTISATYTASDKTWTPDSKEVTKDGYQLIMSNDKLTQAGHSAEWTLYLDTAKLGNADKKTVTVKVTQAKSATETVNNTSTPASYAMKVVPYITGIARSGTTNRSRLGRYAVEEGETITVSGFNFGTINEKTEGYTVKVGENAPEKYTTKDGKDSSAASGATSFEMTVPSKSGGVVVTSGATSSNNNENDNDGHGTAQKGTTNSDRLKYYINYYNREAVDSLTTDYTDDRYLSVWALGNYFKGTDGGVELQKPVMTADKSGNLYASWGTPSNGSITFNYGVNNNSTSIFNCYDQPAGETSVAFDTKGNNINPTTKVDESAAAVLFFGEQQGNGGTWSNVAIASNTTIGGAFTTQITYTDISANNSKGQTYTTKKDVVSGNPEVYLDGDNTSGFYTLASYDMQRRLGAYSNPRNARYKGYLHNVWYDSVNESLKYSVVNMDETNITSNYAGKSGAFAGAVVLDGGYTGQDRCHEWTVDTGTTNQNIGYAEKDDGSGKTATGGQSTTKKSGIKFTNDVFMATPINKSGAVYDGLANNDNTLSWKTALVYDDDYTLSDGKTKVKTLSEGATVAILDNTIGAYKIALRTFKSMAADKKSLVWEGDDLPSGFTPCSFAIYGGNMNVVDGDDDANDATSNFSAFSPTDQSSSAGLSADIDVTSDGYPVVAYYDATNSKLKVAYATSTEPKLASAWKRVDTGLSCSGEVSMRVDSNKGIHIMFMDASGQLCYAYAASTANLGSMSKEVIDTNGSLSYGSISVKEEKKEDSSIVVIPTVTYLNRANTDDCIKYAYRTNDGEWDYQIVPSMGSGHRAVAENKISLESRKTGWTEDKKTSVLQNDGTTKEGTAYPATVDSVIAFKSKQFETAYLKRE